MTLPARSLVFALLAASLLSACGAGRSAECSANRDCPTPQLCVASRCVSSGCGPLSESCTGDADCGLGMTCASGCCRVAALTGCQGDADCASKPATSHCDTSVGACVQCVQARDCGQGQLCVKNVCQAQPGCAKDGDCTKPGLAVCDVSQHACVECLQGSDCTAADRPVCDATHHCVAPTVCTSNAGCAKPTPVCRTKTGDCVGCLVDDDCPSGSSCSAQNTCVVGGNGTCTTEGDCVGNTSAPHCNGTVCVACVDSSQCPAGQVCTGSNACVTKECRGDTDCTATPATPRCDLAGTPHSCVACLASPDCPNGGTCQADHTCQAAPAACTKDSECASQNPATPLCKVVTGGTNVCVQCRAATDCGADQTCSPQNQCQKAPTCTVDGDCANTPATPHCRPAAGSTPSACVACVSDQQCGAGFKCTAGNTCKPVCTAATQGTDCAAPTAVCKESPSGNACVACVVTADCNDSAKICSSSNTCIAKPPACDPAPACSANSPANCCPGGTVCKTTVTPRQCVQCLSSADCTGGFLCDLPTNTCKAPPVGAEGQPCTASFTCNAGLLCVDEGGAAPVCRTLCDPYAAGNPCTAAGTGKVCEWLGFDVANTFFGICEAPNAHGALGASCDPTQVDSCEWNLFCRATSQLTGVCTSLCKPGSTCSSGACNALVGAVSAAGANLSMGYCGPASKWGQTCVRDVPSGTPTPAGDCGFTVTSTKNSAALYCAPSVLPAESPSVNVLATCQFTPPVSTAIGGAASDCSTFGNDQCRSGVCLGDGPVTCYAGCSATADCTRDQDSYPCPAGSDCYTGNETFCMDVPFSTNLKVSRVASCVPRCRNESDCASVSADGFGRTCVAQATHAGSSWQTWCAPSVGTGRAGAKCASASDCESGTCFSASTLEAIELGLSVTGFTATDGYCLGSCLPPNASVCTATNDGAACTTADTRTGTCNGSVCRARCGGSFPACTLGDRCLSGLCEMNECTTTTGTRCDGYFALPLRPSATGNVGVTGYPRYGACVGTGCGHDADCAGYSKDAATPRVCAPYKQSFTNNTDSNTTCTANSQCTASGFTGVCNTAANNPNPGAFPNGYGLYGQNGKCRSTAFALQCAPSLGAAKGGPGAACTKSESCRTGHCVVLPDNLPIEAKAGATAGICFGACTANTDCAVAGQTCKASAYLGMAGLKVCQP